MATLAEVAEWVAGIYQIEQSDPVLGGAPNETTGAGTSNIPQAQLARRTLWLKQQIEDAGIGVEALDPVTSFDAITRGGIYVGAPTTIGTPDDTTTVAVLHFPSNSAGGAAQVAMRMGAINRVWMRRKQAGNWAGWVEMLTTSNVQTSPIDISAGRVLSVGAFGLGQPQIVGDLNNLQYSGFGAGNTPLNRPFDFPAVVTARRTDNRASQIALPTATTSPEIAARTQGVEGAYGDWKFAWLGNKTAQVLSSNGYQRLPSGLILQWGIGGADTTGSISITFPIAFPNALLNVSATDYASALAPVNAHIISIYTESVTGFTALATAHLGGLTSTGIKYFAIGY